MYATAQDMITRFGADELIQLTNRSSTVVTAAMLETLVDGGSMSGYTQAERDATQLVLDAVEEGLEDADAEINPYLQARYTLPLSSTPRVLLNFACDVARYRLHGDRVTEPLRTRYKDAIAFLMSVSRGQADLGLDEDSEATTITGGIQYSGPDRVFTEDTLKDFTG